MKTEVNLLLLKVCREYENDREEPPLNSIEILEVEARFGLFDEPLHDAFKRLVPHNAFKVNEQCFT